MQVVQPNAQTAAILRKALFRAADRLELKQDDLAAVLGLSAATISRLARQQSTLAPDSKEGELALLFLRMFRSLDALLGHEQDKAKSWLNADNYDLGGVPRERIKTIEGLVDVVRYLDAMRGPI